MKSKNTKFIYLSLVLLSLVVSALLFFNAKMRSRKIIGFTNGHNAMCVGRIIANVSTCAVGEDCTTRENWEIAAVDEPMGWLFGRSSKKDESGDDVNWSTMYRGAKGAIDTCYRDMKNKVPNTTMGSRGDLKNNDPRLYGAPNRCDNKYNHGTKRGWRRWVGRNLTGVGNFHADIVTRYCNDETKYVSYRTVMTTKAKKPKSSFIERFATKMYKKAKKIVADEASGRVKRYVCGLVSGAASVAGPVGTLVGGIACNILWEELELGELIGNIAKFVMETAEDVIDFMYETKTEGKSACQGEFSSESYIVHCASPVSGGGETEYRSCDMNIEEYKQNKADSIMDSLSLSDDYTKFRYIKLVEDTGASCDNNPHLNHGRNLDWAGTGVRGTICSGSRNEFNYIACGLHRTFKGEVSAHRDYLHRRCVETGNLDCTVRFGQVGSCLDESIESGRFKNGPFEGLTHTKITKTRRTRDIPESERRKYGPYKEIISVATCTPYMTYGAEDCNFTVCGRVPKDFSRYLKSMKYISPRHIKNSSKPTGSRDDFMERAGIDRLPAADDILRGSPFKPSEIEL